MSAFTNLTLKDGQATPEDHAFLAKTLVNGLATYLSEADSAHVVGQPVVTIQSTFAKAADGISTHRAKIRLPIVDAPAVGVGYTPTPRVAYFHEIEIVVKTNGRGTAAQKADVRAYGSSLLASQVMKDLVDHGESIR